MRCLSQTRKSYMELDMGSGVRKQRGNEEIMELKWKYCVRAGVTVVLVYLLIHYWSAFTALAGIAARAATPLALGCVIAYIVNILMRFLESHMFPKSKRPVLIKIRRPLSMLLAFIGIILIVLLVVLMILPEIIACIQMLLEKLPGALNDAYLWLEEEFEISAFFQGENNLFLNNEIDWRDILIKAVNFLFTGVGGAMGVAVNVISSVLSAIVTFTVAFIFSIYLLLGKEKIGSQVKTFLSRYLPGKAVDKIYYLADALDQSFHSFIVGQCMEAVIIGLLCIGGMLLLRMPYAVMIGCLIGFTALIPVAGAYIGAVIGVFLIFTVSPVKAVVFLVFLVILQQIEGNLIYPKVVGATIGLPGIWVLAAVTVGGGVMGIGGMMLGVPLAAAAYRLLRKDIYKKKTVLPAKEQAPQKKKK